MLNRSASLAMSTSVLKDLPGKLDTKRHSPNILYEGETAGSRFKVESYIYGPAPQEILVLIAWGAVRSKTSLPTCSLTKTFASRIHEACKWRKTQTKTI